MEDLDFLTQTFLGVDLAFRGSIRALSHSKELQSIGIKALLFVGASAWTTYLTINITMLPIRLAYRIATLFLHSLDKRLVAQQVEETALAAMRSVPEILLYCLRCKSRQTFSDVRFRIRVIGNGIT